MTTEIITLANPRNDAEAITKARRMLMENQQADVAEIETATAALRENGLGAFRKNAFDALPDRYKDAHNALVKAVLAACGADAILIQAAASQTAVKNAVKAYKAAWDAAKAKDATPLPNHTYFYAVTCTDEKHRSLQKEIAKADAGFGCVMPQKDAEWRTAAKLFGIKG